jgi:hypothetical protein
MGVGKKSIFMEKSQEVLFGWRCAPPTASITSPKLLGRGFRGLRGGPLALRVAGSAVQRVKITILAIIGRKFGTR